MLPAALLGSVAPPTFAQKATLPVTVSPADSAYFTEQRPADKGYWRLHIEPATLTTVIDFYGRNHALVYQEIIPNQPVKLTAQNSRLLDQVTERLTNSRLLASAAPVSAPNGFSPATASEETVLTAYEMATRTGFRTNAYVVHDGVLRVQWNNPEQNPIELVFQDDQQHVLYRERSLRGKFQRGYNLSQLVDGTYTLTVLHNRKPHTFRVSLHHRPGLTCQVEQKMPQTLASALLEGH